MLSTIKYHPRCLNQEDPTIKKTKLTYTKKPCIPKRRHFPTVSHLSLTFQVTLHSIMFYSIKIKGKFYLPPCGSWYNRNGSNVNISLGGYEHIHANLENKADILVWYLIQWCIGSKIKPSILPGTRQILQPLLSVSCLLVGATYEPPGLQCYKIRDTA